MSSGAFQFAGLVCSFHGYSPIEIILRNTDKKALG
jgi:hypothetical protein